MPASPRTAVPARSARRPLAAVTTRPPASIPTPTPNTILLVDDDLAVREALRRVLRTEGWNVVCAASGEEALEYLLVHDPGLMITDLSMATVSGWDLLFHEHLQRPTLPVFVITALPLTAVAGADKFAQEFFQKPLDLDALLAAVRRYLGAKHATPSFV